MCYEGDTIFNLFPNHCGHVKCQDDQDPVPLRVRVTGNAGVATLWHKSLSGAISPLPDGSDRVVAVHVNTLPQQTVIINTYMPTQ